MAVASSPPAVAQEDYHCMLLQEDLLLFWVLFCFFWVIVSKIWNIFKICSILWVDLILTNRAHGAAFLINHRLIPHMLPMIPFHV